MSECLLVSVTEVNHPNYTTLFDRAQIYYFVAYDTKPYKKINPSTPNGDFRRSVFSS